MSTFNIFCAICTESYKPNDFVYFTMDCGHLFHRICILRWLQHNANCPQCRELCNRNRIRRVYLNYGERTAEGDLVLPEYSGPNWIPLVKGHSDGELEGAIKAGTDDEGNDAYIARAYLHGDLLPANYIPKKRAALAPYGCGAFILSEEVELLVDFDCKWVADRDGHVPVDAVVTGSTVSGEPLYTGRGVYEGVLLPGKVHPSHSVLYMPFKGKEVNVKEYEVLVSAPKKGASTKN